MIPVEIGDEFDEWTVIGVAEPTAYGMRRWLCRCKCGTEKVVFERNLTDFHSRSCGCHKSKLLATHGKTRENGKQSPVYYAWKNMRHRCENPNNRNWKDYGGRGIRVCEGWNDVLVFIEDMGPKPSLDHELDRKDNNSHYSCGHCNQCIENGWDANCKWSTRSEAQNNKRNTVFLEYDGKRLTMIEWSKITGIPVKTIRMRKYNNKWSDEKILTTPVRLTRRSDLSI